MRCVASAIVYDMSIPLHAPVAGVRLRALVALPAIAVPALVAFNLPPSATFLNQAVALVGWGSFGAVLAQSASRFAGSENPSVWAVMAALGVLMTAAFAALADGLPITQVLSAAGILCATLLVFGAGVQSRRCLPDQSAFDAFAIAFVFAGVLSTAIGIFQVFAPEWTGSDWIAATAIDGRAVGNLRQPNHLATLLLWSIVAAVWLGSSGKWPRALANAAAGLMLFGLVLTASRTGMIGAGMLALWGIVDRRLARSSRITLWLVPVLYVVFWNIAGSLGGALGDTGAFHGDTQLHRSDISSSRFGIWANTLSLIAAHPWSGVGWGEFNFAWSLTPFPNRPVAFFDHTHNLPLQLAVELGLPLATLILALLAYALWSAFKAARDADDESAYLRPAFVMVLMIAVHSQLEYPLWYAYFLLPTAFAWGLCLGAPSTSARTAPEPATPAAATGPAPRRTRPLLIGAMLLMIGGIYSVIDYWKVVVIFAPPENAPPLSQRILEGRKSLFFGHHADYAAATSVPEPGNVMPAFKTATHYLLDTRLMMAWAKAFAAHGDLDRARHIAARLREFHNPASDEFFAPCDAPADPAAPKPFQCEPPTKAMDYRDFR